MENNFINNQIKDLLYHYILDIRHCNCLETLSDSLDNDTMTINEFMEIVPAIIDIIKNYVYNEISNSITMAFEPVSKPTQKNSNYGKKMERPIGYVYSRGNARVQWQVQEYNDSIGSIENKCGHCALHGKLSCEKLACHAAARKDGKEVYVTGF